MVIMTEGKQMTKKWFLFNDSTGHRGQMGRKKIYEITVKDNVVIFAWGMAEKSGRQTSRQTFRTPGMALQTAQSKVYEKMDKGYRLAQVV
jgi:predicted DNA-binding WGR domain protein